ncbi:helix-turn-helix domain-containing protein [Chryseobacterium populi]|uniref:DNA-binding domain-containing protein, AraC-type n=1 Tax=Chryseobacterium populi TaxID=1144316 RepID=J2K1M7_9FLAO|nr:AraC family transcriptional regulator [Chryseobacterium populi]EJL74020.1 DNA-binding domain-containing protein, AraC-type [Chryseobacterium populi]
MIKLSSGTYLGESTSRFEGNGIQLVDTVYHQAVSNDWHSHEHAHLTLVLDGGNREQRRGAEYQLTAGQVIFYHSDEVHKNDHTLFPSRNINLEIRPEFFAKYELTEVQFAEAIKFHNINASLILRVFKEAEFNEDALTDHVAELLISPLNKKYKVPPKWIRELHQLLNDNWQETPSLHTLATIVNVHPTTISKYFSQYFGCTLSQYLRKLKIERAIPLLRDKFSISEISYICGFADQSHFIRTFKTETGILPKAFRKL